MGTNILHKIAPVQNTSSLRPHYYQHTGICFLNSDPALGKWKESVPATPIWSHARALSHHWTESHCLNSAMSAFDYHTSHLPWAERRVRGTWRGWAGWACWRRLRRPRQVRRSLCRGPLLLAAPTAEHRNWRGKTTDNEAWDRTPGPKLDTGYILEHAEWFSTNALNKNFHFTTFDSMSKCVYCILLCRPLPCFHICKLFMQTTYFLQLLHSKSLPENTNDYGFYCDAGKATFYMIITSFTWFYLMAKVCFL